MFKKVNTYLTENAPAIATIGSMICTGLAVAFAIKNAKKGVAAKEEYEAAKEKIADTPLADRKPDDELRNKVMYGINIVRAYKESIVLGGTAAALAYAANKINVKTIAGLSTALMFKEDRIKKLYKKAEEIYGGHAAEDLKEAVTCDVAPFDENDIRKAKHNKRKDKTEKIERYYEPCSGRAFEAYPSDVSAALERAQKRFDKEGTLNYNKYGSLLGLADVDLGICQDWDRENPFRIATKIVEVDGIEYIGLIPENDPVGTKRYKYLF